MNHKKESEYCGIFTTIENVNWQYEQLKNSFDKNIIVTKISNTKIITYYK